MIERTFLVEPLASSLCSGAESPAIREDLREPVDGGGAAEEGFLGGMVILLSVYLSEEERKYRRERLSDLVPGFKLRHESDVN